MEMASNSSQVEIFFFPFVGGGHQIPMIDMARVFASHKAKSTIITTPKHALSFQKSISRDQNFNLPIFIHILKLPENIDIPDTNMSAAPFTDTSMLQQPLMDLLNESKPDCIVHDLFHRWCSDVIDSFKIRRISFSGSGCFSRCVQENIRKFKPFEIVNSDYEPFVVPNLPDRIELTKSQLPVFFRPDHKGKGIPGKLHKSEETSFGSVINSFYELESAYADYLRNELKNKVWIVGPVSMCNRNVEDKAERGQKTSVDEQRIISWLDEKEPNSVIYVSFGSLAKLANEQLLELAHGLESSNCPFIWVVKNESKDHGSEENWIPSGFNESRKGLIIRGWAPQLLILEHSSVGGFMTHCGWNSTLEGVSSGVPMVTWPISAEQFSNEKLITDVLKIGVKVGSMDWMGFDSPPKAAVSRDKVEIAVKRLMCDSEEAVEMRLKAKELAEKSKKAVEEGGSSYNDADALIQELKSLRKN